MPRTKMIFTIGPAVSERDRLEALMEAGMDVARFNLSHTDPGLLKKQVELIKQLRQEKQTPTALMFDTRGPEIRTGRFSDGEIELKVGDPFRLSLQVDPAGGSQQTVYVNEEALIHSVEPGDQLLLADGSIILRVEEKDEHSLGTSVVSGGRLRDRQKVVAPERTFDLDPLTADDRRDLQFGVEWGIDFVAASFIRSVDDIISIRQLIEEEGGDQAIIAKIESRQGVEAAEAIADVADGLMVARGDLGIELPPEEVPLIQKDLIKLSHRKAKPVITATQMLESMVGQPRPTRAEASDVANAILDGTDAVMLSAETAVGAFPIEAAGFMGRVAARAEASLDRKRLRQRLKPVDEGTVTGAVSRATCEVAENIGAEAIITPTESGHTARMVARQRPEPPLVAATPSRRVCRKLQVIWGVEPVSVKQCETTDALIDEAVRQAKQAGLVEPGALLVLTAGIPVGTPGTTNMIKVHTAGRIKLRGTGVGRGSTSGQVRIVTDPGSIRSLPEDTIMVAASTDRRYLDLIRQSRGVVCEAGGLTSHAAVIGIEWGMPVIVGVKDALDVLKDGDHITLDVTRGLVYDGRARVGS